MKIAVVGDSCIDVYVYGTCSRICPEGPVPVLDASFTGDNVISTVGMARNVAKNVEGMGAECEGVFPRGYAHKNQKTRFIDKASGQLLLRVDAPYKGDPIGEERLGEFLLALNSYDAVVVSDYDKGFLDDAAVKLIGLEAGIPSFLDTKKKLTPALCRYYDFVKVNEKEAAASPDYVRDNLVVTLGAKGCLYRDVVYAPSEPSDVRSVSGAGDTFLAALAVGFLRFGSAEKAITYANKCAGEVVKHPGTTVYKENQCEQTSSPEPSDS